MKLAYFGYSIEDTNNDEIFLFDIRSFLKQFCAYENLTYKKSFKSGTTGRYLYHKQGDCFLFIATTDKEVIKKLDESNLEISDIEAMLKDEEQIGFASYMKVKKHFLGFASPAKAPKFQSLQNFICEIFDSINVGNYRFNLQPIIEQTTELEALDMEYIGRTTFQIQQSQTLFNGLKDLIGGDAKDYIDIEGIKITIKPKRKKFITPVAKNLIENHDFERMTFNAKDDLGQRLQEYYLDQAGILSDDLKLNKSDSETCQKIKTTMLENEQLIEKVQDYEQSTRFSPNAKTEDISAFDDASSWSATLDDLLSSSERNNS